MQNHHPHFNLAPPQRTESNRLLLISLSSSCSSSALETSLCSSTNGLGRPLISASSCELVPPSPDPDPRACPLPFEASSASSASAGLLDAKNGLAGASQSSVGLSPGGGASLGPSLGMGQDGMVVSSCKWGSLLVLGKEKVCSRRRAASWVGLAGAAAGTAVEVPEAKKGVRRAKSTHTGRIAATTAHKLLVGFSPVAPATLLGGTMGDESSCCCPPLPLSPRCGCHPLASFQSSSLEF